MRPTQRILLYVVFISLSLTVIWLLLGGCTKEKVVIYSDRPPKVRLVYPPNSDSIFTSIPALIWEHVDRAGQYQVQVASDPAFPGQILEVTVAETTYTHNGTFSNGRHYWRVRAQNDHGVWGDWSDATIWRFVLSTDSGFPSPTRVRLVSPPNSDSAYVSPPSFIWRSLSTALAYQIQIASDVVFTNLVEQATTSDTTFDYEGNLANGRYYWRVRAYTVSRTWADWSEALIWSFRINDNVNYVRLLASISTIGIPQDVFVEGDIAYVADGDADLTLVDIADRAHPALLGNIDTRSDDYALAVWKRPGDSYVYVADRDGRFQVLDVSLPLNPYSMANAHLGLDQNLEDITGAVYRDSLYIFTGVSGTRQLMRLYRMVYDPLPRTDDFFSSNPISLPSDGRGVWYDTMTVYVQFNDTSGRYGIYYEQQPSQFVFVAGGEAGLWMIDISATHPSANKDTTIELIASPRVVGWCDTWATAISVQTKNRHAFVATDRGGLTVFQLPDTIFSYDNPTSGSARPVIVATVNTSGRTKDLHIVGDYCFLADGSGGLKVINIANPRAPYFVAAYTTPYAYGIWADEQYIYITDRDNGLMIFENRTNN